MLKVHILGRPEVGKTCFIAGLAWTAAYPTGSCTIHPLDEETKKRFAALRESLEKGEWPQKTFHSESYTFSIVKQSSPPIEVSLEDYAGEDFIDSMLKGVSNAKTELVKAKLMEADLLLVFLDSSDLSQHDSTNSALLQALFEKSQLSKSNDIAIGIVLTKTDKIQDPKKRSPTVLAKHVANQLPLFVKQLQLFASSIEWLPISIVADNKSNEIQSEVQFMPTGYDRVIEVFENLHTRHSRMIRKIAFAFFTIAILCFGIWYWTEKQYESADTKVIQDNQTSVRDLPAPRPSTSQPYTQRLISELREYHSSIEGATNVAGIEDIIRTIDRWSEPQQELVKEEIADLKRLASDRQELLLFRQLKESIKNDVQFTQYYKQYVLMFPNGRYLTQIKAMQGDLKQNEILSRRIRIASISVRDPATLQRRIDEIASYMEEFKSEIDPVEIDRMQLAVTKGRAMLNDQPYHCTLVRTSGLDGPRDHQVTIAVDESRLLFKNSGDVAEKNWNQRFEVNWRAGKKIRVTVQNLDYRSFLGPNDIAIFEGPSPIEILVLSESQKRPTRYEKDFERTPMNLSVTVKCDELNQDAIDAIRNYLMPGLRWQ